MFENIAHFFKRFRKSEKETSKSTAKERLHLVLAQDRANISADFLEMMKQEILEVIKKYIDIDEKAIDVRLTNKESEDGGIGAPALYANIPIITIKNEARKLEGTGKKEEATTQQAQQENNADKKEKTQEEKQETQEINEEKEKDAEQDKNKTVNNEAEIEQESTNKEVTEQNEKAEKGKELEENNNTKKEPEDLAKNNVNEVADEKKNN